jgi:hypothetical protein
VTPAPPSRNVRVEFAVEAHAWALYFALGLLALALGAMLIEVGIIG